MGTGEVIKDGVNTFTPILERLLEIAKEFIPYLIYIAIGTLGVSLIWKAVKYIMGYLNKKSNETIREINDKPQLEFGKHYIVQNGKVIREETEEERAEREADEERNRQNPYYNPDWG